MDTYDTPTQDNPMKLHSVYDIIEIIMPKSLEGEQEAIIDIIKSALMKFSTKKYVMDAVSTIKILLISEKLQSQLTKGRCNYECRRNN